VAHPSPDLYGSDWQLVETIHGLIETGHEVLVALPQDGPLVAVLRNAGARVAVMPFTVLRKALLSPTGLARLSAQAAPEIARLRSVIRASRADVVLSNTVTIPWWPVAASAAGVPVLAHVHEAEDTQRRIIRTGLNAPLLAASRIVANSGAARDALLDAQPRLASRTEVVHNGVAGPDQPLEPLRPRQPGDSFRVAMVGRLSPRKGVDVALDAVGLLLLASGLKTIVGSGNDSTSPCLSTNSAVWPASRDASMVAAWICPIAVRSSTRAGRTKPPGAWGPSWACSVQS